MDFQQKSIFDSNDKYFFDVWVVVTSNLEECHKRKANETHRNINLGGRKPNRFRFQGICSFKYTERLIKQNINWREKS